MRRAFSWIIVASFIGTGALEAQMPAGTKPPAPSALRPYAPPRIETFTLANGMKVLLVERHSLPIVTARFVVDAGAIREPAAKNGVAYLTADLLSEGAAGLSGAQIAEQMASMGASLGTSGNNSSAFVSVTSLPDVFPKALTLGATTLTSPTFSNEDFTRKRTSAIASYQQSQSTVNGIAAKVFARAIYDPSVAYSRLSGGTSASLATITRDDVISWHKTMYSPKNTTLIIIGDLTPASARAAAEQAVGKWNAVGPTLLPFVGKALPLQSTRVILVDRPGSVQSAITVGQAVTGYGNDDLIPMIASARVLGGSGSARYNMNLREKHGWTYGAFSSYQPLVGVGAYSMSSAVRSNATDSSLVETVREFKRIAGEPVPPTEMNDQVGSIIASFPSSVQTVQGLMTRLNDVVVYGLPLDYYSTYRERLAAVTPADLSRVGASQLKPDNLTIVVVGDLKTIEAPVRALNLGTVEVWDNDGNKLR
ncbi:MAG TPA: pitrilysin family protein [Gemmatimonadaceae bacterium]|nr:pitrilysin family protein [Gemmatimonadaceae bacterium]